MLRVEKCRESVIFTEACPTTSSRDGWTAPGHGETRRRVRNTIAVINTRLETGSGAKEGTGGDLALGQGPDLVIEGNGPADPAVETDGGAGAGIEVRESGGEIGVIVGTETGDLLCQLSLPLH